MIESETNAITIGLLCAVAFGFIVLVACVINAVFGRAKPNQFDQVGPIIHPADDFPADWDSWELVERWQRDNPEKAENYLRDAMAHRERVKK